MSVVFVRKNIDSFELVKGSVKAAQTNQVEQGLIFHQGDPHGHVDDREDSRSCEADPPLGVGRSHLINWRQAEALHQASHEQADLDTKVHAGTI